ncbi:MAG: hypothetical protein HRU50_00030 [Winogradskyella sp.]|uniref:hypothetical protein n=1 Tax=Winogradskyella sp. TaxID=1883156 RepID=UPI0025DE0604|nr:hypothetical protein [Winogradskyella sp.]NRB58308.1 hypothetical protein [Winogradskyella sp.]
MTFNIYLKTQVIFGYEKITLLLVITLILWSCSNDNNNCHGIDCLPPATQTGEGTFGCLVNGEPYVDNSGSFNCYYQFVDGEYYFNISPKKDIINIDQIRISSNMMEFVLNTSIELNENSPNEFYAEIGLLDTPGDFTTTNEIDGTIIITKFDAESNIVSALFEFNILIPSTGETIHITEGRFDSLFTE